MGDASSGHVMDTQDVLIHQFQLDADYDICQLPWVCPRRNAQFIPPSSLPPNMNHFLPLEEVLRILKDLNTTLHQTAFNPRPNNPCFILTSLLTMIVPGLLPVLSLHDDDVLENFGMKLGWVLGLGLGLPWLIYFCLLIYFRVARRRRLTGYVAEWNSSSTGVVLSLGGGGTTHRGVTVGSHQGGTYENFHMATWDPKGLMFKGYLHVFVNIPGRQQWCRDNGLQFVMPVPLGQLQFPDGYQAPPPSGGYYQAAPSVGGYQPPPGYALVPISELQPPPSHYQPPPPEYELK